MTAAGVDVVELARGHRALPTHLHVPASQPPWPLVVFAHGWKGHPRKFTRLFSRWTAAGHAVAAPTFPHTNANAPRADADDGANQPADLRFVLDRMLEDSRFEPERVAVAGFSLGAKTILATAFDASHADPRVRAVVAISGRLPQFAACDFRPLPLLVVHGKVDRIVEYEAGLAVYGRALLPKALLTIEVPGHHEYVEDEPPSDADAIVDDVTAAFLDRTLLDSAAPRPVVDGAVARLESDGIW